MASFSSFIRHNYSPSKKTLADILSGPLTRASLLLYSLSIATAVALYVLILSINAYFLVDAPTRGGSIIVGVIGAPHTINPLLAGTETDAMISSLVFSGLLTSSAVDTTLVPDLAERFTVSPDGKTYTFTLRNDLSFHDNNSLTSADVAFTYEKLKSPVLNPATYSYWNAITITTPDERVISFTLPNPDDSFLSLCTLGILPKHLWEHTEVESFAQAPQNSAPVGSGSFAFRRLRSTNSIPTDVVLVRNNHSVITRPIIDELHIAIYANQQSLLSALEQGDIDITTTLAPQIVTHATLPKKYQVTTIATLHDIALYRLNSESTIGPIASILDNMLDKHAMIETIENGYGTVSQESVHTTPEETLALLTKNGFTYTNTVLTKGGTAVSISLAVQNDETLLRIAHLVAKQFADIGIAVSVKAFDQGMFQDILTSGSYSIVLGENGSIPSTYRKDISLYTPTIPVITTSSVGNITNGFILNHPSVWVAQYERMWPFIARRIPH